MPNTNQVSHTLSHFEETLSILDLFRVVHYHIFAISIDNSGININKLIKSVLTIRQCSHHMRDVLDKIYEPLFVELKNIEKMGFQEFCAEHSLAVTGGGTYASVLCGVAMALVFDAVNPWVLILTILSTAGSLLATPLRMPPLIISNTWLALACAKEVTLNLNQNESVLYNLSLMLFALFMDAYAMHKYMVVGSDELDFAKYENKQVKDEKIPKAKINFFNKQFSLFGPPPINKYGVTPGGITPKLA